MKIKIMSRLQMGKAIAQGAPTDQYWVISINCPESEPLFGNYKCDTLLSLKFHDTTYRINWTSILFDEDMADKVIEFLERVKAADDGKDLLIHCMAGVSRSGAVGTFAREFLDLDYEEFTRDNPHICPNPLVMKLLRRQLIKNELIPVQLTGEQLAMVIEVFVRRHYDKRPYPVKPWTSKAGNLVNTLLAQQVPSELVPDHYFDNDYDE